MDVHLPDMNGDLVMKYIRDAKSMNSATPILAVTADVSPERRKLCERAGFDGFIEKPVRPHALIASLADAIVHADSDRLLRRAKAV